MSRAQAWTTHLANLLVGGTGVVYGIMAYAMEPVDEFAIVNHPWQPALRHAHILLAPALVFAIGWIWQAHVWARIRKGYRQHRLSGMTLAATLAPMVVSGYAIQVSEQEFWRAVWVWVHGLSSSLWLIFAAIHPFLPRQKS